MVSIDEQVIIKSLYNKYSEFLEYLNAFFPGLNIKIFIHVSGKLSQNGKRSYAWDKVEF